MSAVLTAVFLIAVGFCLGYLFAMHRVCGRVFGPWLEELQQEKPLGAKEAGYFLRAYDRFIGRRQ